MPRLLNIHFGVKLSVVSEIPTFAYFYPLSTQCPERQARAAEHGYVLPDETQLCQESQPLYKGHNQPVTYCLGEAALKNWDDADPSAMERQIELASNYGIDGFVFDTYIGEKDGRKKHELNAPLDKAFLGSADASQLGGLWESSGYASHRTRKSI